MPQVRDVMSSNVVTVEPSVTAAQAANTMIQSGRGPLPVVEGDRAVGMVTDRDLVAHIVAEGRDPNTTTVSDIASTDLFTIEPSADADEARRQFKENNPTNLDRLLVVEGDRLVGIVSNKDVE